MNRALIHLALHRVLAVYGALLVLILLWILLRPWPLEVMDPVVAGLALVQGCLTAFRLFTDAPEVRPFAFSRACSRRRLFFIQWATGLVLQSLTLIAVAALLLLGARAWIWHTNQPFYPMIQFHELRVLWPIALLSLLAYQLTIFLLVRDETLSPGPSHRWRVAVLPLIVAALILLIGLPAIGSSFLIVDAGPSGMTETMFIYCILVTLVTSGASLHCFRRMEIPS